MSFGQECGFNYGGGGVYGTSSSPVITNCTLVRNSAPISSGGGAYFIGDSPKIINCILWSDSSGEVNCSSVTPTVTYSDIRGGYTGTGNISDNPSFVNPEAGNYHLRADSPCIDAGTDSGAPAADIDGNPRPLGAAYDMGAYEYDGPPPPAPSVVDVYPGDSIQATINAAYAGDVIIVHEGTYSEKY